MFNRWKKKVLLACAPHPGIFKAKVGPQEVESLEAVNGRKSWGTAQIRQGLPSPSLQHFASIVTVKVDRV